MQEASGANSPGRLAEVLHEFGRAPGNYPVRLGEPRELHSNLDTMASWALGRIPESLQAQANELREAAVLFILRACFAPDNNHYQVLGLTPQGLTPETLRTRYRALIRLTHPDMGVQGLPPNAAGIVNRAQEVLSDADLREQYDERMARRGSDPGVAGVETVRRIELRISLAERWRSLNARFPTQTRLVATALGVSMLVVVLLVVAAREVDDGRTLIVRGPNDGAPIGAAGEPMAPWASQVSQVSQSTERSGVDERRTASSRPASATGQAQEQSAPSERSRSATVASSRSSGTSTPVATADVPSPAPSNTPRPLAAAPASPTLRESLGALWSRTTREQPEPSAPRDAPSENARRRTAEPAVAQAGTDRGAARAVPAVPSSLQDTAPPARAPRDEPARSLDSRATRSANAQSETSAPASTSPSPSPAAAMASNRNAESAPASPRAEAPARSPAVDETPVRVAQDTTSARAPQSSPSLFSTGRTEAVNAQAAANASANRPATPREPEPSRSAAASAPPPALPATTSRVAAGTSASPAPQTPATATQAVFQVDSPNAKNYLVRLISSLERPGEARVANNYLADQKVVGSLLTPALQLMTSYPDVVVERMRWTDSERPGVLKVQGSIVLFAHSPQATIGRRVSYRLSAEFWGTATGTVLAELDLRESQ